jgi:diaminopimelate decarboxylase
MSVETTPGFSRCAGQLMVESVPLSAVAEAFGTPCYVYSRARLEANWRACDAAFGARPHRIHYAVKANSNLAILGLLHRLGSGFDIVSGGELTRVLAAGARGADIVFSGVGKSEAELKAALDAEVACINVESEPEMERLSALAQRSGKRARIAFRVNPDVDPKTHPYISTGLEQNKFGVPMREAEALYARAARLPGLEIEGVACHIGSQMTDLGPLADAIERVVELAERLESRGIALRHLDLGGGLGIRYAEEEPPSFDAYVRTLCAIPERFEVHLEPGRAIVGNAGVLLTRVEYLKTTTTREFAVCDAAMTELIRPALYEAWHGVERTTPAGTETRSARYDLVGPVCESADFLAQDRELALAQGDVLALMNAGAYGFAMASNYNSRPRPPEIIVDGNHMHLARARETLPSLMEGEKLLP